MRLQPMPLQCYPLLHLPHFLYHLGSMSSVCLLNGSTALQPRRSSNNQARQFRISMGMSEQYQGSLHDLFMT